MIVGGYTLDLYCDGEHCKHGEYNLYPLKGQFYGSSRARCFLQAKSEGWRINDSLGKCKCLGCVKDKKGYGNAWN